MLNLQTVSFNLVFQVIFKNPDSCFIRVQLNLTSPSIPLLQHTHSAITMSPCAKPTITGKIKP